MTDRKPAGVGFGTWVERQIREAAERGEFDNLPGAGKPIADLDKPHDELWWVKDKLRREQLSYLPPTHPGRTFPLFHLDGADLSVRVLASDGDSVSIVCTHASLAFGIFDAP